MSQILISGGSGFLGGKLISKLNELGHSTAYLTRSEKKRIPAKAYIWDPLESQIEDDALKEADVLIHLAGAGIADKPWTEKRKKEIYNSRVLSTEFLAGSLKAEKIRLKKVICASAVGYYGDSGDKIMSENDPPGDNFLAKVCMDWEKEAKKFEGVCDNLVILRIGIVLANESGALPELVDSIKLGVAAYLGNGKQYFSWIHINDLVNLFIYAIHRDISGTFNAVAPNPVTNKALTNQIKKISGKAFLVIPAPAFALKIALGQMASMLLETSRCSSDKIESEGFSYEFPDVDGALKNLLNPKQ